MMKHAIYGYLKIPFNRTSMIKKIDNGLKTGIQFEKDEEVDKFTKDYLLNWTKHTKQNQLEFCEWLADGSSAGQQWALNKKEHIKDTISTKKDNIKNKIKNIVGGLIGSNYGRNDYVIIQKGSKEKTIKYKKIDKFLEEGWKIKEDKDEN